MVLMQIYHLDILKLQELYQKCKSFSKQSGIIIFKYVHSASDDLDQPALIRSLLVDIRQARQTKSRDGVIKMNEAGMAMTGISQLEINELRPFFIQSFNVMTKLGSNALPSTFTQQSQSLPPRSQFTLDEDGWDIS